MGRQLMLIASLLSSFWLTPVFLLVGTKASMEVMCLQQRCARSYAAKELPVANFKVIVSEAGGKRVSSVLLSRLPDFMHGNAGASLAPPSSRGETIDGGKYSTRYLSPEKQLILLRYVDASRMDFQYEVDGSTVRPISSKVMSVGYMFWSLPAGIFLAWLARHLGIRWRQTR